MAFFEVLGFEPLDGGASEFGEDAGEDPSDSDAPWFDIMIIVKDKVEVKMIENEWKWVLPVLET